MFRAIKADPAQAAAALWTINGQRISPKNPDLWHGLPCFAKKNPRPTGQRQRLRSNGSTRSRGSNPARSKPSSSFGSPFQTPPDPVVSNAELRKAAVLLMGLERSQAAGLLSALDARQLGAIAGEIARGDDATPEEFSSMVTDLRAATASNAGQPRPLGVRPDAPHVATRFDAPYPAHAPEARPRARFDFLQLLSPKALGTALRHEHPQIVTVVLSHVSAKRAAEILAALPAELAGSVLRRLATIGPLAVDAIDDVERSLKRRLAVRRSGASGG
jgi:hypothetical protein